MFFLPDLQLFLPFLDVFLAFIKLLEVVDFQFNVGLVNDQNLFVKFLDLLLGVLDLLVHALDVLFPLSEVLPALMFLLLEVLLKEAEIACPFVVDAFSATLSAGRRATDATE
jgi:hypothetical protein